MNELEIKTNGNALTVSDIHLFDYSERNPTPHFRLFQWQKVALNILKVAKEEKCDIIIFTGDIVERAIMRPYIEAEVQKFLDTVMKGFVIGFLIYGNHDQDNKSSNVTFEDSSLSLMLPPNLHYAHQKCIMINGTSLAFSSWQPQFDLSWIEGKVDILFTHATICYAKDSSEGRVYNSQKLDESKFDLAICGDIHKKGAIGKYVSVGCAQRCKLGDPEEATAVVVDTNTKTWKWVDLNPDDNLIKFKTTDEQEKEGWHQDENTWYVYKQPSTFLDPTGNIKVDAWEEINILVDDAIQKNSLVPVHNEVLKQIPNIDEGEVDFNFTLLHLHCENWRSIKNADIDFTDMDKILLLGSNGAGKTSILTAIKFAFCDVSDTVGVSSLKPFVTFGEKNCLTEVTFSYQGSLVVISRGTASYGLTIDGIPQKYNEKKAFEKDVRERFPFVRYMDAFFFDADKTSFLKSQNPERITEITSKFLKLNRIETLNNTARAMYDHLKMQWSGWDTKAKEVEKVLSYIHEKQMSIALPSLSKEDLLKQKQLGLEIQRQNSEWNRYNTMSISLKTQIDGCYERLKTLGNYTFRDDSEIESEITTLQNQISGIQQRLAELGKVQVTLDFKNREFENLRNEGNKAWTEAKEIGLGKKCSQCGQVIENTEALETHRRELLQKVEDLKPQIETLKIEIQQLQAQKDSVQEEYGRLNSQMQGLNVQVSKCYSERNEKQRVERETIETQGKLQSYQNQLQSLGVVEKVELPEGFMEKMNEIENGISSYTLYEDNEKDRIEKEKEYSAFQGQVVTLQNDMAELERYIKVTGPTGIIFEEIFNKLSAQFSSTLVKYQVERKGKGNREHLSLVPYFNKNGNWSSIQCCSSGERTMLDIDYMSKIIGRLGLMVLDEFLKNLDGDRLEAVLEIIKNMNIGCLLLTTHADSIPVFNNRTIRMSINGQGMTDISI